jgi:hypothetical protein
VLNGLKQLDVDRVPTAAHATGTGAASAEAFPVAADTALRGLGAAVIPARDWRTREREGGVRRAGIQIDGGALDLPYATARGNDRLAGMFPERHAAKAPG